MAAASLLPHICSAEPPKLETSFAQKRLTVGDRFTVTLRLTAPNDARIEGPLADSLGPFVVADQRSRTRAHRGHNEHFYDLKLAGFRPGSFALPRFKFLVSQGDRVDTLGSDTLKVVISSVLPEKMGDIHQLKPAEAFPNHWLWLIPACLLALLGLGYLGYRLYLRYRRYRQELLAPLPPWDEAHRSLEAIPVAEWLDSAQHKRYYYTLSEITKKYLERRFEFNAVEQTTTEISASMKRWKTPLRDEFGAFLSRADMVKYAKIIPPRDEMESAIETVRDLVDRTRPAEPPAEVGKGKAGSGR